MVKAKKAKTEFSDEVINNYLRQTIDAGKVAKDYSDFKSSLDHSGDSEED